MAGVQDKIAIVTGGADGMGAATSRLFVERGAAVIITDVKEDAGKALAAELGGPCIDFLKVAGTAV